MVALDLANVEIASNAVCPGRVLTPLVEPQIGGQAKEADMAVQEQLLHEKQPMFAFSTPAQIGALAVCLCSDGTAFPTDGRWTA